MQKRLDTRKQKTKFPLKLQFNAYCCKAYWLMCDGRWKQKWQHYSIRHHTPCTCLSIHFKENSCGIPFFACFFLLSVFTYYLLHIMRFSSASGREWLGENKPTNKIDATQNNNFIYYRFAYWISTVCSSVLI